MPRAPPTHRARSNDDPRSAKASHPGTSRDAVNRAAPAITPSTMTGTRAAAPTDDVPGQRGDLEPAERGERAEPVGGVGPLDRRRQRSRPCRARVGSSIPVPRPVTSAAGRPVKAAIRAADGVVLAMPMSPVNRHRMPPATSSAATVAPMSSASHRLVAGHRRTGGQIGGPVGHPAHDGRPATVAAAWRPRRRRRSRRCRAGGRTR